MTSTGPRPAVPTAAGAASPSYDPATLDALLAIHRGRDGGLLPLLHAVQDAFGCVPPDALATIARAFNRSRAEVHGVVSYYHFFRSRPAGRHVVQVCRAESCKATGGDVLFEHARRVLDCEPGTTRADGAVTLEPVFCLGLCAMSPAIAIDERPYARMTLERFDRLARAIDAASVDGAVA